MSGDSTNFILITGAGGMLGRDVVAECERRDLGCGALDRAGCDLTSFEACDRAVSVAVAEHGRVTVINCGAYTDVNRAESEEGIATLINGEGVRNLARACVRGGARLVHVSTDYVFNGKKAGAYEVTDGVDPLNAYGRSKLAGEVGIQEEMAGGGWCIARTSWLYGAHGPNFVKTMLALAGQGKDLKVIDDQVGAPTYTVDLARGLVDLAVRPDVGGILHVTNGGECSWFEFARAIFELSGRRPKSLSPCGTVDFPTPAMRPANSRLSGASLERAGVELLPDWRDGLRRYLMETGELAEG